MSGERARLRRLGVSAGAVLAGAWLAGACTIWNGVTLPPADSSDAGALSAASLPANGFVTLDEAIAACSVIAACPYLGESIERSLRVAVSEAVQTQAGSVQPYDTNFSLCVDSLSKTFEPTRRGQDVAAGVFRRMAQASSCSEAGANVEFEMTAKVDPRCAKAGTVCGDDVTELVCDIKASRPAIVHCSAPSGLPTDKCVASDPRGRDYEGCVLPAGPCPICEGNVATYCTLDANGALLEARVHIDCTALGMSCIFTPGNLQVGCATDDNVVRQDVYQFPGTFCDGNLLVHSDGRFMGLVDCPAIGGRCAQSNGAAQCELPSFECTAFSPEANSCTDGKIHVCVGGRWQDVACPFGCSEPSDAKRAACLAAFQ